ncbi:MAG: type II toxin-antitoxin system VapC family toxin [Anaerolineales bacterium]|jgi:predicted nucleic acid-binding protein
MSTASGKQADASGSMPASDPNPGFIVVDASIWVSRLVLKDVFHRPVKVWMEQQRAEGTIFLSPALLLPEVAGAISRRTGEPQLAKKAIDSLMRLPGLRLVEMDQPIVQEAASLASDLGLRGADSIYVAVCARLNLPLATLDEDQKTKAASITNIHSLESKGA